MSYAYPPAALSILVEPPTAEPITLDAAKLRAGLDWAAGDPRDAMMRAFIAAARAKVEHDTGLALLTQTREVWLSAWGAEASADLPSQCRPLQAITSIEAITSTATDTLDPVTYTGAPLHTWTAARVQLLTGWDPRARWVIRLVSGWETPEDLAVEAPLLVHAVALLTAHYATLGRDIAITGTIVQTLPYGYEEAIAPYRIEALP